MIVSNKAALLWQHSPADISNRLTDILNRHSGATVFFRADDIAIPSASRTDCSSSSPSTTRRLRGHCSSLDQPEPLAGRIPRARTNTLFAWHRL
jgi:hypothetical protein